MVVHLKLQLGAFATSDVVGVNALVAFCPLPNICFLFAKRDHRAQTANVVVVARRISGTRFVARLVVVDDDDDTREMTAELLAAAGYAVRSFADGAAALHYLLSLRHLPNLVVTDIAMPRMDGDRLIEAMKADPRLSAIPLLVVSGTAGIRSDGIPVLAKPVTEPALLAGIASALASVSRAVKA